MIAFIYSVLLSFCRPPVSLALTSTISMIMDVEHLVLTLKVYDFFNHLVCALVLQTIFSVHRCHILYIVTLTVCYFCRPSLLRAAPEQPLLQSAKTFYTQPAAAAGEKADHLGIFVSLACSLGCFLLKKIELAKK